MAKSFIFDNELGEVRLSDDGERITLRGGPAPSAGGTSGGIRIVTDSGVDAGAGGQIDILAGSGGSQGGGGDIKIKAGYSSSNGQASGGIEISAGSTAGQASGGDVSISAGPGGSSTGAGNGGSVSISAGSVLPGSSTAWGGDVSLSGGDSIEGRGGAILLSGGDSDGTDLSDRGGEIELKGGSGRGKAAGGAVSIVGGLADGSGDGGAAIFAAGPATKGDGGDLDLNAGDANTSGGDLIVHGGDFLTDGASNTGGDVRVRSGRRSTASEGGGEASLFLEKATGEPGVAGAIGGKIELYAGAGRTTGGEIAIVAGDGGSAAGTAGPIVIRSGRSSLLDGGPITIKGGASAESNHGGGSILIEGGSGAGVSASPQNSFGGNVTIKGGRSLSSGDGGSVFIQGGLAANDGAGSHDGGDVDIQAGGIETTGSHGEINFRNTNTDPNYSVGLNLWDESDSNRMRIGTPIGDFGADIDLIFPAVIGTGGQFLTTDGAGNLGWGNPASATASGGGKIQSDGTYAPEGGAGLGIGQTWTGSNLFGVTRAANTNYTNNSSCPIAVAITFTTGDDTNSSILVNGVEVSKWDVEGLGSPYLRTLYAVVPAGQSYMGYVRGSTITRWTEMTTTGSCANPGGLGVNQIWGGQGRSLNTAYTNNSGYPIALSIKLGVASGATATLRVSNSGAPGAGDEVDQFNATTIGSNPGDNFVTLFGVVPNGGQYDVTTSGSVINAGWYELRGPTPVNGGGLGVGQTWTANLNPGTRVANTAYENTDSCPRHIQVRTSGVGSTVVETGASAGTLTEVSRQDPGGVTVDNTAVIVTVPAGRFYRVTTSNTITSWKELDGGTCSAAALTKMIDADQDTFVRVAQSATGDEDTIEMRVGDNSGDYDVSSNIMELSTGGVTISVPDSNGNNTDADGGSVTIQAGDGDSSGTGGAIFLQPGYGGSGAPAIPTGSGVPEPTELWFVDAQGTPGYVGFKAPDTVVTNTVWTLPDDDGSLNQAIVTDGSGVLSFGYTTRVQDADGDTKVDVEESTDEDTLRVDLGDSPSGYPAVPNALVMSSAGLTVNMGTADVADTAGAPISITAGGARGSKTGGAVSILGGAAGGSGSGGSVNITAADGGTFGGEGSPLPLGGDVRIEAGDGYGSGSGAGYAGCSVFINAGDAALGNAEDGSGVGGRVFINGGDGGAGSSEGGGVTIKGGAPGTNPLNRQGGNIAISGGEPSDGNTGSGGDVTLLGGGARGAIDAATGRPGNIGIFAGGGYDSYDGSGGDVLIRGGGAGAVATTGERGGDVTVIAGSADPSTGVAAGGVVQLLGGSSRGIGEFNGPIRLTSASQLYEDPAHLSAVYVDHETGHLTDWPMELRFMQGGGQALSPYNLAEWVSLRGPVESTDINDVILTIRNTAVGNVTDSAAGTSGFTVTKITEGSGSEPEVTHLNCLPAASLASSGPGDYWTFNDGTTSYYVWYQNGTSVDPTPVGTAIQVTLGGAETAKGVAQATETAINGSAANTLARVMPGVILTLPASPGTSGQVLTTDGSNPATMSWQSVGSGTLSWPLLANPNGTAGAPAYSFSGKPTVGMYSAAANTIGFATDGDPRVTIDNNALTLFEEGSAELELRFRDGTDGTYVGLKAPDNVTTQTVWALPVDDAGTDGEVLASDSSGQLKFQKMEYIYSSTGTPATTHAISHNLNQQYVTYTIWDRSTNQRINNAATETATDANTLTLTFTVAQDIIVSIMGVPGLAVNT